MGRKIKLKEISSKIFSLSYPEYRFFVFLVVLTILFLAPISFLESSPNFSICFKILGSNCPSLGILRGVSSLLKGNLVLAVNYNFLSIPVLIVMVYFLVSDFFKAFINNKNE